MNYELAKELKQVGFPQDGIKSYVIDNFEHSNLHYPTLHELIEACGEKFSYLRRDEDGWWCMARGGDFTSPYSNPEEAVAKLWLILNPVDKKLE